MADAAPNTARIARAETLLLGVPRLGDAAPAAEAEASAIQREVL